MVIKNRLRFTLIELLIVLTIIALIAGVVGINIQKAMRDQRFKSEVATFVDRLRLAQDMMLIAGADVHFKVEANEAEKQIKYWIETDKSFSKAFDPFIKKVCFLKTTHRVSHASGKDGLIDLKFLSKGSVMSSGNIQLYGGKFQDATHLATNVMLNGYPSPIFSSEKIQNSDTSEIGKQDANITTITIHEIQLINSGKKNAP